MDNFYSLDYILKYLFSIENELENYTDVYFMFKIRNYFYNGILANLHREYRDLFKI